MHLHIQIITNSLTHLYFSAFISPVIRHYLMLLDFIWQELIIDSIIVKECWQTDFTTLSSILDTIWLLPSSPTSCSTWQSIKYLFNKTNTNSSILEEVLLRISAFFLRNWVITPFLPYVTKTRLSVMKLVCQRPVRRLFIFRHVFMTWFSFTRCGLIFLWIFFHESEVLECLLRFIFFTLRMF